MAPESLAYRNYSKKSDVWTFGIVVYEIVAQREPHKDQDLFEVGSRIRDEGLTPTIPSTVSQKERHVVWSIARSVFSCEWKGIPASF
jgi:serine/threonine protein kinase